MSDVKVKVSSLTKSFGDLLVLDKISFSVNRGEFLCIVGPTGCGKTTFLNSLTKILETDSGSILIDGEEVNPKKHNLAYILQEYSALPWLNVEENIAYGLKIKGIAPLLQLPQVGDKGGGVLAPKDDALHGLRGEGDPADLGGAQGIPYQGIPSPEPVQEPGGEAAGDVGAAGDREDHASPSRSQARRSSMS